MLRNGPSFFPTTYGQPYPDYPATSTFFDLAACLAFWRVEQVFGGFTDGALFGLDRRLVVSFAAAVFAALGPC